MKVDPGHVLKGRWDVEINPHSGGQTGRTGEQTGELLLHYYLSLLPSPGPAVSAEDLKLPRHLGFLENSTSLAPTSAFSSFSAAFFFPLANYSSTHLPIYEFRWELSSQSL